VASSFLFLALAVEAVGFAVTGGLFFVFVEELTVEGVFVHLVQATADGADDGLG
jgi:hypothetical protein